MSAREFTASGYLPSGEPYGEGGEPISDKSQIIVRHDEADIGEY